MGYQKNDKIFTFDGVAIPPSFMAKNKFWKVTSRNDLPYGSLHYSSLYLTNKNIKYYVDHFLNNKPSIIRGYPSFIHTIAEYLNKNNIELNFKLKGVQLTAENIFEWQIEDIKNAFNTNVYLQYGHSEMSVFAYTIDETYEYYCSPFYGFTEIIGQNGKHVDEDELGEIVVTSFYNTALPFIRYKTGDMAIYGGNEQGIVKLKSIEGRKQDFVYKKDKEKVSITAIIFGQHYKAFKNIVKWQIQQSVPGKINIKILRGKNFSEDDKKEIIDKFKSTADIEAQIHFVDNIELTKRGKFRFVVVAI
jgi:phenylacetate-CoA ligase